MKMEQIECSETSAYTIQSLPMKMEQMVFRNSAYKIQSLPMKMEQTVFRNVGIYNSVPAYEDGTDSVPKRRHIQFSPCL